MQETQKTTNSSVGSSKVRKYVYSDQLRFLSKVVNERQTADSLSVDNMEESQLTTVERNKDAMNNLSQEIPFLYLIIKFFF